MLLASLLFALTKGKTNGSRLALRHKEGAEVLALTTQEDYWFLFKFSFVLAPSFSNSMALQRSFQL